ncbi:hypothetical protein ACFX5K_05450 [Rickettsiales bacterium LUAb2]
MSKIVELKEQVLKGIDQEISNIITNNQIIFTHRKLKSQNIRLNLLIEGIELENKQIKNYQYNINFKLFIYIPIFTTKNNDYLKCQIIEKILGFLNRIEYNFYCSIINNNIKAENINNIIADNKVEAIEVSWLSNLDLSEEVYH